MEREAGGELFYRSEPEEWLKAIDFCLSNPASLVSTSPAVSDGSMQKARASSISLDEFSGRYLEYVRTNLAPKTLENAARVMGWFRTMFKDHTLSEFTLAHLEKFKQHRKAAGAKDTTINIDVRTVKAAFQLAVDWKMLDENPFEKAKQIRVNQQVKAYFTDDELISLLGVIKDEWFARIVKFAILTGLRRGEILNLTWGDYDVKRGTVSIESTEEYRVKGGKKRKVPLPAQGRKLLEEIPARGTSEKIFLNDAGKSPTGQSLTKKFKRAVKAAGLSDDLHFHSLRHTFGTKAANSGVASNVLKAIMGHSSLKTTEGYMGTDQEAMKAQIEKVALPDGQKDPIRVGEVVNDGKESGAEPVVDHREN